MGHLNKTPSCRYFVSVDITKYKTVNKGAFFDVDATNEEGYCRTFNDHKKALKYAQDMIKMMYEGTPLDAFRAKKAFYNCITIVHDTDKENDPAKLALDPTLDWREFVSMNIDYKDIYCYLTGIYKDGSYSGAIYDEKKGLILKVKEY